MFRFRPKHNQGPAAVPIILGISAAISAGTAGYQINEANEQQEKADAAAAEQKRQQDKALLDAENEKKALAQQEAAMTQKSASESMKRAALLRGRGTAAGRSGTILTSPLGVPGTVATGSRTILGS